MSDLNDRQAEIDDAFMAFGCPGVERCDQAPVSVTTQTKLFPCTGCKAPKAIYLQNPMTKVYRSYADYCDD